MDSSLGLLPGTPFPPSSPRAGAEGLVPARRQLEEVLRRAIGNGWPRESGRAGRPRGAGAGPRAGPEGPEGRDGGGGEGEGGDEEEEERTDGRPPKEGRAPRPPDRRLSLGARCCWSPRASASPPPGAAPGVAGGAIVGPPGRRWVRSGRSAAGAAAAEGIGRAAGAALRLLARRFARTAAGGRARAGAGRRRSAATEGGFAARRARGRGLSTARLGVGEARLFFLFELSRALWTHVLAGSWPSLRGHRGADRARSGGSGGPAALRQGRLARPPGPADLLPPPMA